MVQVSFDDGYFNFASKSVETPMSQTITSSFDKQPQNAHHVYNTDLCVDSCDTSLESLMARTITSPVENQPQKKIKKINKKRRRSFRRSMDTTPTRLSNKKQWQGAQADPKQKQNRAQAHNAQQLNTDFNPVTSTKFKKNCCSEKKSIFEQLFNNDMCVDSISPHLNADFEYEKLSCPKLNHYTNYSLFLDAPTDADYYMRENIESCFLSLQHNALPILNTGYNSCSQTFSSLSLLQNPIPCLNTCFNSCKPCL
jgi:hypothetical protein